MTVTRGNEFAGAIFSKCGAYRYLLWRHVGGLLPATRGGTCLFLMQNPSTADHRPPPQGNDRTVSRCQNWTVGWGFERLAVANIFALRSTDPDALLVHADPVGPANDAHILAAAKNSQMIVCAWGNHKANARRAADVTRMLRTAGLQLHYLRLTEDGQPGHPLYLPAVLEPQPWNSDS